MSEKGKILGLTGPSGSGKGYAKNEILRAFPETFSEPVVVTTRQKREDDGKDRKTGLLISDFNILVEQGEIIFAHQPFGPENAWYGFERESLEESKKHLLTEIHIQNIKPFKDKFNERLLILGLIADQQYLIKNLEERGAQKEDLENRIIAGIQEILEITNFFNSGEVDHLINLDEKTRDNLSNLAIIATRSLLSLV